MSETKWTPGPWEARQAKHPVDGEFDWGIGANIGGRQRCIAEAFGRVSDDERPNAEANARLMAAAPDLAAALEGAWGLIAALERLVIEREDDPYTDGSMVAVWCDKARAALAKAKGETP